MMNSDIKRYIRDMREPIHGHRRRKMMTGEFLLLLDPFLEENPDPTYQDLEDAFGPPEQFAFALMQTIPDLPKAPKRWQRRARVIAAVSAGVAVVAAAQVLISNHRDQ